MTTMQPPQIGCGGEDTTTNTTETMIEMKQKRAYKRRNFGGDTTDTPTVTEKSKVSGATNTPTVTETKKRPYKRKNCGDATVAEAKNRKDCGGDTPDVPIVMKKSKVCCGTNTPTLTEPKKRPYKRKKCGDANTPTESETKKRKDCGGDTPDAPIVMKKSKVCCGTNTPTVTETKKRPYKRKNCGDVNTSTVMETEKTKDSSGDTPDTPTVMKKSKVCGATNTPTVSETKKRPYKRKKCGDANTSAIMDIKKKRAYIRKKHLPHDLIVEQILTKLPVPTLLKSVLVSKLWYNSIHNDHKRLTYSYFLQSQKQPQVILSLLNVRANDRVVTKAGHPEYGCHFFKFNTRMDASEHVLKFDKFRGCVFDRGVSEMVGYCRGLPCVAAVDRLSTCYLILDPNRKDFMCIFHPVKVGKDISETGIICHGFGFDHLANEYKLVSIFRTAQKELNFMVHTLGTKSWRNVTATGMAIPGHDQQPILKIRAPKSNDKSAIFFTTSSTSSSGCLVWKIIATLGGAGYNDIQHDNSNEMEMLLSFNLHDEKFQFIQLPAKRTTDEQQQHVLVDYPHLLEFKGSPCIARIETVSRNGNDYPHRRHGGHEGSSDRCCCCCKVHLYVLKDKVKQVWVKEETFDVRVNSLSKLAPDPCCFCLGSNTRILSFSDQMLLYWFNGKHLQVYNLRSGKLQLVLTGEDDVFRAKRIGPQHMYNYWDDYIWLDDGIDCFSMDSQLHCHEENFLSLQTFIPEGAEAVDVGDFSESELNRCSAYVFIHRSSKMYYPSY